jgi:hypothetical protein
MKRNLLLAAALPATSALLLAGCASATTACAVQHGYAIVVFQNGMGNYHKRIVTRFRLSVRYGPGDTRRRVIGTRLTLGAASGGNPPIIVRSYRVGPALGCHVDKVAAHR